MYQPRSPFPHGDLVPVGGLVGEDLELRAVRVESPPSPDFNFDPAGYCDERTHVLGKFGAPKCHCTSSVFSLVIIMLGMVLGTIGFCMTAFFASQETLVLAPGITFMTVGTLLMCVGCTCWGSEFCCNDCVAECCLEMKEAPEKNARKRREKRLRSAMSGRASGVATGSRLSMTGSRCPSGLSQTTVLSRY